METNQPTSTSAPAQSSLRSLCYELVAYTLTPIIVLHVIAQFVNFEASNLAAIKFIAIVTVMPVAFSNFQRSQSIMLEHDDDKRLRVMTNIMNITLGTLIGLWLIVS